MPRFNLFSLCLKLGGRPRLSEDGALGNCNFSQVKEDDCNAVRKIYFLEQGETQMRIPQHSVAGRRRMYSRMMRKCQILRAAPLFDLH